MPGVKVTENVYVFLDEDSYALLSSYAKALGLSLSAAARLLMAPQLGLPPYAGQVEVEEALRRRAVEEGVGAGRLARALVAAGLRLLEAPHLAAALKSLEGEVKRLASIKAAATKLEEATRRLAEAMERLTEAAVNAPLEAKLSTLTARLEALLSKLEALLRGGVELKELERRLNAIEYELATLNRLLTRK